MLSWLSKHGDDWADRMALGGHVSFMKSAIVYSRDAMARPVRVLESMLSEVRAGLFCPDETRSGRFKSVHEFSTVSSAGKSSDDSLDKDWSLVSFPEQLHEKGQPVALKSVVDLIEIDPEEVKREASGSSDTESDAMTTSSSEDGVGAEMTGAARRLKLPTVPDELKLMQHTKYKTLHLMEKQNFRVMLCGRTVVDGRYAPADVARFDTPCCHQCWKRKPEYER